jgi:hypothetical protein
MKAALVYGSDFPFDGTRPTDMQLDHLRAIGDIIPPSMLATALEGCKYTCIVNLHGRYFPKTAWKVIKSFLNRGNGLVSVGCRAFSRPVILSEKEAFVEREQTAYHRELNIRNIYDVTNDIISFEANNAFELPATDLFANSTVSEFSVKFTHSKDNPKEHGSSGPMDAVLYPLVFAMDSEGRQIAAPLVLIENQRGSFSGGRWLFLNQNLDNRFWGNGGADLIIALSQMASRPVVNVSMRPSFASYYPSEQPLLLLQMQVLGSGSMNVEMAISIHKGDKELFHKKLSLDIGSQIQYMTLPTGLFTEEGFYNVEAAANIGGEKRSFATGFWGYDQALLESGSRLEAKGDYFTMNGRPFPVRGMTYMASDVHKKFLFLPNPSLWMKEFAFMRKTGVNLVRTGLWTAFRNVMFIDGVAFEETMRAIDAFVLTARYYDIHVVFNFFAFTPEMWEGVDPYLDPACIEAQKRYILSVVSRYKNTSNISWDLINEPAAINPETDFMGKQQNRGNYELVLWREWLKTKYKEISILQENWNCTNAEFDSFEQVQLPKNSDFAVVENKDQPPYCASDRMKSLMVMDYSLFTNYVFSHWASEMAEAIRTVAPHQFVAVGQDHPNTNRKPHPYFHGKQMDYTSVHTWWNLDDIYWDSAFVKIPDKPALVQETGVMYVEDNDEKARRTELDVRDLLERKIVYAFAAGTAGVIPWVLNTNVYMDIDNEVHIGMLRADLTEKPEFQSVRDIYGFIGRNEDLFENAIPKDVCIIFPFANSYSNRAYSNIATRKSARVLVYNLKQHFYGCGDFDLSLIGLPKLIIYPSPRVIPEGTWEGLLQKARDGATVLVTGPICYDSHWGKVTRAEFAGMDIRLKSVQREETVLIGAEAFRAVFDSQLIGWVDKEMENDKKHSELYSFKAGKGNVMWCPLPIEMNRDDEVIEAIYNLALAQASVDQELDYLAKKDRGIFIKKLKSANGSIYLLVSEDGDDRTVKFTDRSNGVSVCQRLPSGRAIMISVDVAGKIIDKSNVN